MKSDMSHPWVYFYIALSCRTEGAIHSTTVIGIREYVSRTVVCKILKVNTVHSMSQHEGKCDVSQDKCY